MPPPPPPPDIRWHQRLQNFHRAFDQLAAAVALPAPSTLEQQGLIQCFEYTYELAWNTLKDWLLDQGDPEVLGSRDAIRKAFKLGLLTDGEPWFEMIRDRTLTVHTYQEETATQVVGRIRAT
jgi:nucleotidyltransferase substrate binding protein (TIGR01987 family)